MKLAWFRADTPQSAGLVDDSAALIAELRTTHDIEIFTAANAHDFVWKDFRAPYDLSVYELDDTPAHAFIWPYLLHDGGVLRLRTLTLHDSRAAALLREQRAQDYVAEFTFNHGAWPGRRCAAPPAYPGNWPMLRVPLLAARIVVVSHQSTAAALEQTHPEARVRVAATGVQESHVPRQVRRAPVTFGTIPTDRLDLIRRAMARASQSGAAAELTDDTSPERLLRDADVIVSLPWSPLGEPRGPALAAMAAGKPVIVLETATTADWPALDPQTWRPRGLSTAAPIAVSIDPRDEEHSLVLAIRRLSADATLRAQLGEAAHNWWRTHATPSHAADDWGRILSEAASLSPLARPTDWPGHLTADGSERARGLLDECGVTVDFL
jgi:hypothetical protein